MTRDRKPKFFYGYIVVVAAFSIQMVAFGVFVTYGVFFNSFLIEFGWTRATIAGASSLSFLIFGLLSIMAGRLSDKIGPRMVMVGCSVFAGFGYLLMSQVNTIWQFYLFYGLIVAIGFSGMDVLPLSTIARWFVKRRGMMSGIVKTGAGVGILIMPPVTSWLIASYGWRTAYIILGIIALVFLVSAAQFLRRDPAQMGQLPDGGEKADAGQLNSAGGGFSLREAIHLRQFWMLCAIYFLIIFCVNTILVHIVLSAVDLGISATNAANILAVIGGASIVGRFVMGSAGDRIGNKSALIVCFAFLSVALLWLQAAKELRMLYLFAVVYGFAHGGFFALVSPIVAGLFGLSSHGALLGTVLFGGTVGGAIGPVLSGYLFDMSGSYQMAFLVCFASSVVGLILTLLLKPTKKPDIISTS